MSNVVLNGITLPCDPDDLNFGGKKRGAVFKKIDGGVVIQDRGFNAGDQTIHIKGRLYDSANTVVRALYALYRSEGTTFTYSDFRGNSVTVVFTPGTDSLRVLPIRGSNTGYEYEMFLTVTSGSLFA